MLTKIVPFVLSFFCLFVYCLPVTAQEAVELSVEEKVMSVAGRFAEVHSIDFMGIPLRLSPAEFVSALREKGFSPFNGGAEDSKERILLIGDFAGVHDCKVEIYVIDGMIWKVCVMFPDDKFWMSVKERYSEFKKRYSQLHGEPASCEESLSKKYREGSDLERWGFENGYSRWRSRYDRTDGSIVLEIRFNPCSENLYLSADYIDRVRSLYKTTLELDDL